MKLEERIEVGQIVADSLFHEETQVDEALIANADLTAQTIRARIALNLPISVGNDIVSVLAGVANKLASTRTDLVRVHALLDEARLSVPGLDTVSFGSYAKPTASSGDRGVRIVPNTGRG